jgi:hypothetical protein
MASVGDWARGECVRTWVRVRQGAASSHGAWYEWYMRQKQIGRGLQQIERAQERDGRAAAREARQQRELEGEDREAHHREKRAHLRHVKAKPARVYGRVAQQRHHFVANDLRESHEHVHGHRQDGAARHDGTARTHGAAAAAADARRGGAGRGLVRFAHSTLTVRGRKCTAGRVVIHAGVLAWSGQLSAGGVLLRWWRIGARRRGESAGSVGAMCTVVGARWTSLWQQAVCRDDGDEGQQTPNRVGQQVGERRRPDVSEQPADRWTEQIAQTPRGC